MAVDDNKPTVTTIISRAEAGAAGLKRYFTGKPCKRGHVDERYVVDRKCVICQAAKAKAEDRGKKLLRKAVYRANNKEKIRAENAAYEKSAKRKASVAARRAKNKKKRKAYMAAWYETHAEKARQDTRAWQKANPDRVRAIKRNREARRKSAEGCHTAADITRIYGLQGGKCAYCKKKVGRKYHIDHIVPLSKGGSNWAANLQILCQPCNQRKYASDPIEHAQKLGLLI